LGVEFDDARGGRAWVEDGGIFHILETLQCFVEAGAAERPV
jgi:hypothetical protein